MLLIVPITVFALVILLIRAFAICPKPLWGHLVTALVWTVITGGVTASLTVSRSAHFIAHLTLLVSGLVMVPCGKHLLERWRGASLGKGWQSLRHVFLNTLWGPLTLFLLMGWGSQEGQILFQKAMQRHDLATAFLLRDYGLGNPDYLDKIKEGYGQTWLQLAVERGDTESVSDYLAINPEGTYSTRDALSRAVVGDNAVITELILNTGADPDGNDEIVHYPPLHMAVRRGKVNQVRTLLRHGANPKALNGSGETALHVAKASKNKEIIALLTRALNK